VTKQTIHFGTSGWRGVIADDFTFAGVRRASAAIAGHVGAQKKNPKLVVGHDTRFFSPEFARTAAGVLRKNGCEIVFCSEATPLSTIISMAA
jgi:phosphomannomutase